jgi:hypothetical protein
MKKMKNSRIYPIRTSATQAWNIKLYSSHKCNESCQLAYVSEEYPGTSVLFIVDNPDYDHNEQKCSKHDTYHPSSIHLSKFKREQPTTVDGELLFSQQIVIPESSIYLYLSFPFSHAKKIQINSESSIGFSLGELVDTIREVYQWAYEKEEQTASDQHFSIQTLCPSCSSGDQTKYYSIENSMNSFNSDDNSEKCPICLEVLQNEKAVTKCNHFYHPQCIQTWVEKDSDNDGDNDSNNDKNKKCPLCRAHLLQCDECDGGGWKIENYVGKVVPKSLRGFTQRNQTDGIFGIYNHDYEDLFLEHMVYHRITKTLHLKIFG